MTGIDLLREIDAAGIELVLTDQSMIKAAGHDTVLDQWVPTIRNHKSELINTLREWEKLKKAIQNCCCARGDSEENLEALLKDCWQESEDNWTKLTWYFHRQTALYTH